MKTEHKDLFLSLANYDLLGLLLYLEGRGEPIEGRIAIACVVRNRTRGKLRYHDVILAPKQFSCFLSSDQNYPIAVKRAQELAQGDVTKKPNPILRECIWIAQGVISGVVFDNTSGANHYYNPKVCNPSWAAKMTVTRVIKNHKFLRA